MNATFVLLSHSYPNALPHNLYDMYIHYYKYSVMSHHFESLALCRGSDVSLNADLWCHSVSSIKRNTVNHTPVPGHSSVSLYDLTITLLCMKDAIQPNPWVVQGNYAYLIMQYRTNRSEVLIWMYFVMLPHWNKQTEVLNGVGDIVVWASASTYGALALRRPKIKS